MADAINWIWQGVLLVLVASACSRLWRASAAGRYAMWWAVLAAVVLLPLTAWEAVDTPGVAGGSALAAPLIGVPAPSRFAGPFLLGVWATAAVWALARLTTAAIAVGRMKRACVPFPELRARRLTQWNSVRGHGRIARLALSPSVASAAVLGGVNPVIAVSPTLLRELDDRTLDLIVLHEWAHVQRRDDTAQVVEQIVRALFGVHPAVWWAVREIRLDRELACDDRVVELTGARHAYALCLTKLASVTREGGDRAVIPAALWRSQLTARVLHLVQPPSRSAPNTALVWLSTGALLIATLGTSLKLPLAGQLIPRLDPVITIAPAGGLRAGADGARPLRIDDPAAGAQAVSGPSRARTPVRIASADEQSAATALPVPDSRTAIARPAEPPPADTAPVLAPLPTRPLRARLPGLGIRVTAPPAHGPDTPGSPATPWSAAADAAVAIGRGSTTAARATAGFFTRLGKSIGGRF